MQSLTSCFSTLTVDGGRLMVVSGALGGSAYP